MNTATSAELHIREAVSALPFRTLLSEAQLCRLEEAAELRSITSRQPIAGDNSGHYGLVFVLEGSIRCYVSSEGGKEVTLFTIKAGSVCLLSSLNAGCQALTDCRLLFIEQQVWNSLLKSCPELAGFAYSTLQQHLKATIRSVEIQSFSSVEKRVASLLAEQLADGDPSVPLRITHSEIALHLGTAREVVSRTLESFAQSGILKLHRGSVTVLDADALRAIL